MLHDVRGESTRGNPLGTWSGFWHRRTRHGNRHRNTRPDITCNRCNQTGHFANRCTEVKSLDGTVIVNAAGTLNDNMVAQTRSNNAVTGTTYVTVQIEDHVFQFLNNCFEMCQASDDVLHGQHIGQAIPKSWILLDNQSTVDLFCNGALLRNVR
jgi:Zinc knuckle